MNNNEKRKIYTIKDIAKEADVSISTVSHVINKTRYVKEGTKNRVLDIIKKYGYVKDFSASSLRSKSTKLIGLIITDISNMVFSKFTKDLESIFYNEGYNVTICNSDYDIDKEINYLYVLRSRNVDGVIIFPCSPKKVSHILEFFETGIPLVVIEREATKIQKDIVLTDVYRGYYDATKYLIDLGHNKIAFLGTNHSRNSLRGYYQSLEDNNLELVKTYLIETPKFTYLDGYNAMEEILDINKNKPTAILTFNDAMAIGAIKAIKDNGYKVPEDFSIIGCDNVFMDDFLGIGLTSISFPTKKVALNSAGIILGKIKKEITNGAIINIETKLIVRDSVSKPKQK